MVSVQHEPRKEKNIKKIYIFLTIKNSTNKIVLT